ncbi:DUF2490 domain-containing protein [uncultured Reyranella sp.]|uniref:DUF2490 domain-containing protein n=1 Tax=uncultured Reyranella sp. TaxID=735512 RepID=UPI0025E82926|nr:DUF2490 domain-containing protein [uncultured Reyranella sp.]
MDIVGEVSNPALRLAVLLTVLCLVSTSAQAQRRQQQRAAAQTQSGNVWETPMVGLEYQIDGRWSFHLDAQFRFDQNMTRLRSLQVRPGFEYILSPNWALAAGYVQFTRYLQGARQSRGPFQDILYRTRIDGLPFAGRLRWEELFFDDGRLLVRTRALAGVRIPLWRSPWELALSDEAFINVSTDRPARISGFAQNRAYIGFGRQLTSWVKGSLGYELDTIRTPNGFRNEHNIKLNLAFSLN